MIRSGFSFSRFGWNLAEVFLRGLETKLFTKIAKAWSQLSGAPLRVRIVMALTIVYLLSPIDIIPDFLPVIGSLDDVLVIALVTRYIRKHVPGFELTILPKKKSKKVSK